MKQTKITKIITFIAAAALTMGIAFSFSAGAETATDSDLAIAGKNIVYSDTLTIRYAVPASKISADAKLVVSDGENDLGSVGYFEILTTDKIAGTEDTYYIFEVTGIPASDVCKEIVVHIEDGEKVGPELKYSLAEYFYERLYADGVVNAAEVAELYQKKLYLSYLEYAANAQDYFHNFKNGANEALVTDRHYVNVVGGTAGGAESGVYLPGAELTLAAAQGNTVKGWHVTTYTVDASGNVTVNTVYKNDGATITLKEGTNATLITEGEYVGEYFAQYGGLDYNSAERIESISAIQRDVNGYTIANDLNKDAGKSNRQWLLISDMSTDKEANKVLQFSTQSGAGPKLSNKPYATLSITGDNTSGNCFVFETDIMIADRGAMTGYIEFSLLNVSVDGRPTSLDQVSTMTDYLAYINIKESSDGTVKAYMGENGYSGKTAMTLGEWHNIRVEVTLDGKAMYYIDGEQYYAKTVKSGGFSETDFAKIANRVGMRYGEGGTANTIIYLDNTFVGIVNK